MPRWMRLLALFAALGLLAAACGDDGDESADETTTTTSTTESTTTTTTVPSATAAYNFDSAVDETQATQAAETMTRRLEKAGHDGSEATVNAEGTGLDITVTNVTTPDEAKAIVEPLLFIGSVHYRPVVEGPLPPGPGETPSEFSEARLGADLSATSIPGSEEPTATTDDVNGTVLLAQYDSVERTNVIARWRVGPSALDGTTTEDADVTTFNGNNAVQVVMKEGEGGLDAFNAMGQACFNEDASCPTGLYAIDFDGAIATASGLRPNQDTYTPFGQDDLIIHSEVWTPEFAEKLALALEAGALPVGLTPA